MGRLLRKVIIPVKQPREKAAEKEGHRARRFPTRLLLREKLPASQQTERFLQMQGLPAERWQAHRLRKKGFGSRILKNLPGRKSGRQSPHP